MGNHMDKSMDNLFHKNKAPYKMTNSQMENYKSLKRSIGDKLTLNLDS